MNALKRTKSWWSERKKKWTIAEDFGGDLVVSSPFGQFLIRGEYKYDRFTAVWNTPHKEMWLASAGHDWICDELNKGRPIVDFNDKPIIRTRQEGDAVFLYLMVEAVRIILIRDLHRAARHDTQKTYQRAIKRATRRTKKLMDRIGTYHWGVRTYWNLLGRHS